MINVAEGVNNVAILVRHCFIFPRYVIIVQFITTSISVTSAIIFCDSLCLGPKDSFVVAFFCYEDIKKLSKNILLIG
jgi:hypothetical protein